MDWRTQRKKKGKKLFVFFAIIGVAFLLVGLLQYLWNILIPEIFGLKAISYWQAFGLLILSKILFGRGFRRPGGARGFRRHWEDDPRFSEEERNRLKEEWKRRFRDRCC